MAPPTNDAAQPICIEKFLTDEGKRLSYGQLRKLVADFAGVPGVIGLHGGLPPPEAFPFTSLSLTTSHGDIVKLDRSQLVVAQQQYAIHSAGFTPLREWAKRHITELHDPARNDFETVLISGATQGLSAFFTLFLEQGDLLLVEEVSYPQVTESLAIPKGVRVVAVPMDESGARPDALDKLNSILIQNYKTLHQCIAELRRGEPSVRVKAFYTVPTCQNPTGITTPLSRRRELYNVCRKHDLLILEDDPYYYLQFPETHSDPLLGLRGLPRQLSYLHLDVDARVFRIDTFAKFLAPGVRLGWVTAGPAVSEPLAKALQMQTLGPCGLTQVVTHAMLEQWDEQGLDNHLRQVQKIYLARLEAMLTAADSHLTGLATWERPTGGMFLWLKIDGLEDTRPLMEDLMAARVVAPPGGLFHPAPNAKDPHVRLAFSFESEENIEEAVKRLGEALRSRKERTSH